MIRNLLFVSALIGATTLGAFAQQPAMQAKIRVLAFTHNLRFEQAYARDPSVQDGAEGALTPIDTHLESDPFMVPTRSRKIVFTTKPDFGSINRPNELIGEATLPANARSAIFVFLPGKPGDKAKSQILAFDDSKQAFPAGALNIVNISPQAVRLTLEKNNYDFTPGKTLLIAEPPLRPGNLIGMQAFVQKGSAWAPLSTSIWSYTKSRRKLAIIYQNQATAKIELRTIEDTPATETVELPQP
jgi:hypothetical protein